MPVQTASFTQGPMAFSPLTRFFASFVSVLFHPLLLNVMMAAFMIYFHPAYFTGFDEKTKLLRFLTVVNNNFVLLMLAVLLMKALGFVKSIYLKTQKERVAPYIIAVTFFFWTYYIFRNLTEMPQAMTDMCQGIFFSACVALLLNSYYKISMHGIGVGGLAGLMVVILFSGSMPGALPLVASFLIAGLVCSARMIISDHNWFDVITGFIAGLVCQIAAAWVI
jgi:hypothetical protein